MTELTDQDQINMAIWQNLHTTLAEYKRKRREYVELYSRATRNNTNDANVYWEELNRYADLINDIQQQIRIILPNIQIYNSNINRRNNNVYESPAASRSSVVSRRQQQQLSNINNIQIPETKPITIPKNLPDNIPEEFLCPITTEIMSDPVMLSDGQVYEKKAIQKWLANNNTSPLTKIVVDKNMLIPCFSLRKLIQKFIEDNKESNKASVYVKKNKREPSKYNLFVKEKMPIFKEQNPGKPTKELMKLIGEEWKKCK